MAQRVCSLLFSGDLQSGIPQPVTFRQPYFTRRGVLRRRAQRLSPCRFICIIFSICFFFAIVFLVLTWATVVHDARSITDPTLWGAPGLRIVGDGLQFDSDMQKLSVLWRVVACDASAMTSSQVPANLSFPGECTPYDRPFNVYLNDPTKPAFSYSVDESTAESSDVHDRFTFTMSHSIYKHGQWDPVKQLGAPFERYTFRAVAFAIDPTTNHSLHIQGFTVTGILGDFVVHSHDAHSTSTFTYDSGNGFVTTDVASRLLQAGVERSTIAKLLSTSLFLTNWLLAASSLYTTFLMVLGKIEADDVLAPLPLFAASGVFTIHTFSSSPPFGASVDKAAFFVQILVISLCCLVLLIRRTKVWSLP